MTDKLLPDEIWVSEYWDEYHVSDEKLSDKHIHYVRADLVSKLVEALEKVVKWRNSPYYGDEAMDFPIEAINEALKQHAENKGDNLRKECGE